MIKQKLQSPGYGENNPEPAEFRNSEIAQNDSPDALHADQEYVSGQNAAQDKKPHMPCKNSMPT